LFATEIYAEDAFLVSNGILAVDTNGLRDIGIDIVDDNGRALEGVIAFRTGLSVTDTNKQSRRIAGSVDDLSVFDINEDLRIDAHDAPWDAMYLAVDYNGDGDIGSGEYALIGECGVNAISLDLANNKAWSLHRFWVKKEVKIPDR
jgi:hypothetical protein